MAQALHICKILLAVGFIITGTVCMVVARDLALPLFVGGIAWTQIPE